MTSRVVAGYVEWAALGPFQAWVGSRDDVPDALPLAHWDWDGPVS